MDRKEETSERIAQWLERKGLNGLAAFILEAGDPLLPFGAQALYLMEPFLISPGNLVGDVARLLEDPIEVSSLAKRLREGECEEWTR